MSISIDTRCWLESELLWSFDERRGDESGERARDSAVELVTLDEEADADADAEALSLESNAAERGERTCTTGSERESGMAPSLMPRLSHCLSRSGTDCCCCCCVSDCVGD